MRARDVKNARTGRLSGNGPQPSQTVTNPSGERWELTRLDRVFGVGQKLEVVTAATREAAELIAREKYGSDVLVTIAGGKPKRADTRLARDLGSTRRLR